MPNTHFRLKSKDNFKFQVIHKLHYFNFFNRFNVIQNVSSQAFCGTSLYQLTLRDNSLSSVPDLSCVGHVLGVLILSENLLTEIHRQDFYGLTALEKLSLMTNGIKTIEQDTFYHLTALKVSFMCMLCTHQKTKLVRVRN